MVSHDLTHLAQLPVHGSVVHQRIMNKDTRLDVVAGGPWRLLEADKGQRIRLLLDQVAAEVLAAYQSASCDGATNVFGYRCSLTGRRRCSMRNPAWSYHWRCANRLCLM